MTFLPKQHFSRKRLCLGALICFAVLASYYLPFATKTEELDDAKTKTVNGQEEVNIQDLDQQDKRLWRYIRTHHIFEPSVLEYSFGKDMELTLSDVDSSVDVPVFTLFKNKTNLFFVEVGGYDGFYSHTLIFERDFKWRGLLIECHPKLVPILKSVNRKAYISDLCISTTNVSQKGNMNSMDNQVGSSSTGTRKYIYPNEVESNFTVIEVQTVPLYAIIASIDVQVVDLLVLDVQSIELEVLKHFPFELILVKVWIVEVVLFSQEEKRWLVKFMASKDYPEEKVNKNPNNDYIFVHETFHSIID